MEAIRRLIPSRIRRSYVLKLGIVLLIVGLSVGIIGFASTMLITDSVEANALADQEEMAAQEALSFQAWHEGNEAFVSAVRTTSDVQSGDEAGIDEYFSSLRTQLPEEVISLHYVDPATGEILSSTDDAETLEAVNFPEDELADELTHLNIERTGAYTVPDEQSSSVDERGVISYYVGVDDSAEEQRALVVTVDLTERSKNVVTSDSTVMTIVDDEGRIVSDDGAMAPGTVGAMELQNFGADYDDRHGVLDAAAIDGSGSMVIDDTPTQTLSEEPWEFAPEGHVAAYHTTSDDWTVIMHTDDQAVYGFVNTVNQWGTLATIAGVLLIGMLGLVVGRSTAVPIDRLTDKAAQMEEGNLTVDLETDRIDNIGRLYEGFDSMRDALTNQIEAAEQARQQAEQERERTAAINSHLEQKADEYSTVMERAADGDLTARMDTDSDNAAMAEIATAYNQMLAQLEQTVADVSVFALEVATASEEVTASSEEVRTSSEQVSSSIQDISHGAERQNDTLQSVTHEMGGLSTTTEEIAASSNEVADLAEKTATTGTAGREAANEALAGTAQLEDEREAVIESFDALRTEVSQVDELIAQIAQIAEQTNMLALNANIEASRSSGGDDDGFGVVAKEVKELSQTTKETTEEIADRLERIQAQTQVSAEEIDRTSTEIEHVTELVENTATALEEIATYAEQTNRGVQEISAATEEQAASTEEVVAMVDTAATISQETTTESETVAAAAEEQTMAMTAVSESVDDLAGQANRLSALLDRFETDTAIESEQDTDAEATLEAAAGFEFEEVDGVDDS